MKSPRTELRDVAGSISVITKDFMNDLAPNNLEDLLTYTAGTEVDGVAGDFSASGFNSGGFQEFTHAMRGTPSNPRVRGLGAADQSAQPDGTIASARISTPQT
ncbi:TonB-dependent receptor plug domain-containing protein [Horticoccus sp. 23ND18S-11]|uniref:TonB-dependent receptor plug domain-containing protein n=1 Tax=Horticoccus sp. 23ND18S-11 TaxID=3391832 RepID=UPI0039C9CD5B